MENLRVLLTCFDSRRESQGDWLNSGKMQLDKMARNQRAIVALLSR